MIVDITLINTMWKTRVLVLFIFNFILIANCKRFDTRCKLVRELLKIGIPNDLFLGQWVCLAEKVSNRDTSALVTSPSGKKSYGIYQIPSMWCKEGKPGGECNMRCEALLDDDIKDDTECALKIFHQKGFQYWPKWVSRCKNDMMITREIYKCPDLISRSSPDRTAKSDILRYRRMLMAKSFARSGKSVGSQRVLITS